MQLTNIGRSSAQQRAAVLTVLGRHHSFSGRQLSRIPPPRTAATCAGLTDLGSSSTNFIDISFLH